MATRADSLTASAQRPLALRRRGDVQATAQFYQGKQHWILKDPVVLKYFRLQDEEHAIWEMLDGQASLLDVKNRFETRFAPTTLTLDELQTFVGSLHKSGLVWSDLPGQGPVLFRAARQARRQRLWSTLANLMSLRLRGIDPDWLLMRMLPYCRWFFQPWCVAACLMLALSALLLVLVQYQTFAARLPGFENFFTVQNALWLSLVLGLTKVVHEFGHGLSCKYYGGECHEMGVMFLVFTPCLYCDVSDSWTLPSKWRRAAIGAAGMYVELVMASIATFVWWFSEPGIVNHLALNVILVCSVSTLMFNGNPLLRYDGYYILADLLEIPNLRQKAGQILTRSLSQVCAGIKPPPDSSLPTRGHVLFIAYSIASAVYKWVVVFSILFFLNKFLEPYRLDVIGQMLAIGSITGMVVAPLWGLWKFFSVPGRMTQVKPLRIVATAAALAAVLAAVVYVPFPQRVHTTLVVEPRDAAQVFVQIPGRLVETLVREGDVVEAGQSLARLENEELEFDIAQLAAQLAEQQVLVESLEHQRFADPTIAAQLPSAIETLHSLEERLAKRQHDVQRLTLRAPRSGRVLPPPAVPKQPAAESAYESGLAAWHGVPLDARNRRAYLEPGTLFCQIGEPDRLEAQLVIDQADVEFVHPRQTVELLFEHQPGRTWPGEIVEVARQELRIAPRQLAGKAGGGLATQAGPGGAERPLSASYQARVPLDDAVGLLAPGLRGRAKISVGEQTWGAWLWRTARQTFHFKL